MIHYADLNHINENTYLIFHPNMDDDFKTIISKSEKSGVFILNNSDPISELFGCEVEVKTTDEIINIFKDIPGSIESYNTNDNLPF